MPSALISLLLRCSILILLLLSSLNLTVAESLMPALVLQESQQKKGGDSCTIHGAFSGTPKTLSSDYQYHF